MKIPTITELPRKRLSYSQVSKYLRCPRQYALSYIVKGEDRYSNEALVVGAVVHEAMADVIQERLNGRPPDDALDYGIATIREELPSRALAFPWSETALETIDKTVTLAIECLLAWWKAFGKDTNAVAVEEECRGEIGGVPCLAYIDLRRILVTPSGPQVQLVDYKVTGRAKPQTWVDDNLQMMMYAALTGVRDVALAFIQKPTKNKPAIFILRETQITDEQLRHCENIVRDVNEAILKNSFPRREPGSWECSQKYCDSYAVCRPPITPVTT